MMQVLTKSLIHNTFVPWSVSPSVKAVPAGGMTISWSGAWLTAYHPLHGVRFSDAEWPHSKTLLDLALFAA
jgi:hypothetical protein